MKKNLCRSLIVIFLLAFTPFLVNAKIIISGEISASCQNYITILDDSDALISKYGLELKVDTKGNDYEVVMNTDSMDDSVKKKDNIEFKVSKVEGYNEMSLTQDPNDSTKTIRTLGSLVLYESDENVINNEYISSSKKHISKSNKKITINKNKVTTNIFVVTLVPVGFKDSDLISKCGDETTFELTLSAEFNKIMPEVGEDSFPGAVAKLPIVPFTGGNKKIIDCNGDGFKSWDKDSFNYKFCEARSHAKDKNNKKKKNETVYCDVNKMDYTNDYYVNKDYFMITTEKKVDGLEPYRYNYTCDKESTYSPGECKIKCEEVVTVEYGPPVASKAGLCFEYKVQVISRVSCGVSQYPDPPKEEEKICTPLPVCTIPGSNIIHRQGGPNEDFDNCVIGCDGGVYSDRCTNKCYKKVYGKSKVRKTYGDEVSFEDKLELLGGSSKATVEKTSNSTFLKYYCSNNKIIWDGGQNKASGSTRRTTANDSRWHNSNYWGHGNQSNYGWYGCTSDTGIPRNCNCQETCYWTIGSCRYGKVDGKNVVHGYMNPGEARAAYNSNVEAYNRNKSKCELQVTCNTSMATFTIATNVNGEEYKFPFSGQDTIKRENNTVTSTFSSSNTTVLKDSNIGCYTTDSNEEIKDLVYGVAWSFPGTYINNKTGEIAYKVENTNHWMFLKDKFCLPFNTSDVNQKWWNYYYTKKYQNKNTISFNTTEYKNNCTVKCNGFKYVNSISNVRGVENTDIDWNISAHTTNFGHNDWDITIKCFYAANKDDLSLGDDENSSKECKETCDKTTSTQKRIRSVDLSNMFPSSDGSNDSRVPGFNWSSAANNTIQNTNYTSLPSKYADAIQNKEKNGSVFNDSSELDYHFVLDRKAISELRKIKSDYTTYSESVDSDNVLHYRSEIINTYADKHPLNGSSLRCNNLKGGVCDNTLTN